MIKTKNGLKISLNEYDNEIIIRTAKNNKLVKKVSFSDYVKAVMVFKAL